MKLTKKQIEIVFLMQNGYILLIGQSETSFRPYYMVSKGYTNVYFRSDTFARLMESDLIYQELSYPFNWLLTKKAKELVINNPHTNN